MKTDRTVEKIFGVGLGRTGTKSLAAAVNILGYRSKHAIRAIDQIDEYTFCSDILVTARYKFLDYIYPNAKFILTTREVDSWIDSCKRHSRRDRAPWIHLRTAEHRWMVYGTIYFKEFVFRSVYFAHIEEVKDHFHDRLDKLLLMDICAGDGWEKLCPFLNKDIPDVEFPHMHKYVYL